MPSADAAEVAEASGRARETERLLEDGALVPLFEEPLLELQSRLESNRGGLVGAELLPFSRLLREASASERRIRLAQQPCPHLAELLQSLADLSELEKRLEKILSRYPNKRAALLPVLNLAQEIRGHLPQEAMEAVAEALDMEPATVRGVATFYTMYNKRPVGRHLIQVCTNVACNLCGGHEVFEAFLDHTGTEAGQISEDGEFTVIEAECLGACGFPTVVQINNRYFEDVEPGDVPAILERLKASGVDPRNGAGPTPTPTPTSRPGTEEGGEEVD